MSDGGSNVGSLMTHAAKIGNGWSPMVAAGDVKHAGDSDGDGDGDGDTVDNGV